MTYIITRTGRCVSPIDPRPEDIHIGDIAHALANLCRFAGHTNRFYSVAEHSVRCSFIVDDRAAFHALLHDASEAYLVDIPTPIKTLLPEYKAMEERMMAVIYSVFEVDPNLWGKQVKQADLRMSAAEARDLMPVGNYGLNKVKADDQVIVPWNPLVAEEMFLNRFSQLRRTDG
jgi:5'-deoxynucleotidase YfbR-like HD superfamily hydrolase